MIYNNFPMLDLMSAVELMDPKMDMGMSRMKKHIGLDVCVQQVFFLLISSISSLKRLFKILASLSAISLRNSEEVTEEEKNWKMGVLRKEGNTWTPTFNLRTTLSWNMNFIGSVLEWLERAANDHRFNAQLPSLVFGRAEHRPDCQLIFF